jgi:hypothetical protein
MSGAASLVRFFGPDVGLNAEFNVSAWRVCDVTLWREYYCDRSRVGRRSHCDVEVHHEVYIFDNEDDTWSLSMRHIVPDDGWAIEDLLTGTWHEVFREAIMMHLSTPRRREEMVATMGGRSRAYYLGGEVWWR